MVVMKAVTFAFTEGAAAFPQLAQKLIEL